jgi:hypothetical protein
VSLPATFADAEGAVKAWVNSLTTDLVGTGKPARISARIYGPSKEAAALAAAAYANALVALATGAAAAVPGAQILTVDPDTISGPLWTPDFGEPRYLVDADFYLRPA